MIKYSVISIHSCVRKSTFIWNINVNNNTFMSNATTFSTSCSMHYNTYINNFYSQIMQVRKKMAVKKNPLKY